MGMLIQQLQLAQTLEHHHTAETLPSTAETIPENQPERDSRTSDNITSREASPPPSCIDNEDIEIGPKPEEEHNKLLKHRTWIGPFGRAEIQTLIQVLNQT